MPDSKLSKKYTVGLACAMIVVGIGVILKQFVFHRGTVANFPPPGEAANWPCPGPKYTLSMPDSFLSGILEKDQLYTVTSNYYACNHIEKDDLVLYRFSEYAVPVVRLVKAASGDTFHVVKDAKNKRWNLEVNGELVKDGKGEVLWFGSDVPHMLSQYETAFKGRLESDLVILMSNTSPGFADSTNFGVMSLKDIVGKVEPGGNARDLAKLDIVPLPGREISSKKDPKAVSGSKTMNSESKESQQESASEEAESKENL